MFRPALLRYKGRRIIGRHAHTLLSYRGSQIVFTAEDGCLSVSITPRPAQTFPAREILDCLGFDTALQVEESIIERLGGGDSYIYRQALTSTPCREATETKYRDRRMI